jgi:hypothetical protein
MQDLFIYRIERRRTSGERNIDIDIDITVSIFIVEQSLRAMQKVLSGELHFEPVEPSSVSQTFGIH